MLKPLGKPSSSRGMKRTIICMVTSLVLCLGLTCFGTAAPSHTIGLQTGTTVRLATSNSHTGNVKSSPNEEGHFKTRLIRQVQLQIEQSKEDHEDEEEVHQVGDEEQIRTNGIKDKSQEKESVESKSKETEEEVSKSDIQRTTPGDQEAEKSAHKLDDDSQEAELEEQGRVGVKKSAAEAQTHDSETQEQEAEAEKFDGGTEEQESTDAAKLGEGETKGQEKGSIKEQWETEREEEQNNDTADAEGPKARVGKQKTSGRWYGSDAVTEEEEEEGQEETASRGREHEDGDRDDKYGGQEEEYQKKKGNERGVDEESREVGAEKESEESRDEDQETVEKMRTAERRRQQVGEARREAGEVSREKEEEEKRKTEEEIREAEDERKKEVEEEKQMVEEKKQEVEMEKQDPEDAIEEAENKSGEEGGVEKNDRTPDHEDKKGQRTDEEKLESKEGTQNSGGGKGVAEDESKEEDEAEIRKNEIEYQGEDDDRGSVESNGSTEDEIRESEGVTHVAERAKGKAPDDSLENKSETDKRQGSKGKNSDEGERWKRPQDNNKKKSTTAPKTKLKEKKAAVAERRLRMKGGKTTAAPGTATKSARNRKFVGKTTFTKARAEKDKQGMMDSSAEAPEVEEEGGAKRGRTNGRHRDRLKLRNTNSTWVSDKFIAAINSKQTEWKAGRNFRADIRSKVLKRLVGERLGSSISWSEKFHSILPSVWTTLKGALMSYIVTPESFDLRDETDCVMRPLDTGLAATSWALSTAQSVEDRWCGTTSVSPDRTFSSQYLINCCDACTDQSSTNAGSPMEAYNFMQRIGIPGKDCKPYSSSPVMRTLGADAVSTKMRVPRIVNGCSSECDESDLPFVFTDLCKIRSYHYIVPGWASSIKHEIRNRGSVTAEVTVYTDFLNYKEGVYSPVEGAEPFGDLTLRLIGWNGSHSQLHWLAVGVWGKKWGDRGMVKLKAFNPRLNLESRVSVSTVDGTQCKEAQQPEVTGFTIEASDVLKRRLAKIRSRQSKARFMSSQSLVGSKKRNRR